MLIVKLSKIYGSFLFTLVFSVCGFSIHGFAKTIYTQKGKAVSLQDLPPSLRSDFYNADKTRYLTQRSLLEEHIVDEYFKSRAKAEKITLEAYKAKNLSVKEPTEKQLKKFYTENKKDIPYAYDVVKDRLVDFYKGKTRSQLRQDALAKALSSQKIKVQLSEPQPEALDLKLDGYASKGKAGSKITVVEFADYQCPHCKAANQMMVEVLRRMKPQPRYVFIDYPINPSGVSRLVAQTAFCVRKHQGDTAYWKYHNAAYAKQDELTAPGRYISLSKETKTWSKKVESCIESGEAKKFVTDSESYGDFLGVRSTPTFYVNGKQTTLSKTPKEAIKTLRALLK